MDIKKRVVRFIGGLCFAFVFIIFAVISIRVAPHSADVDAMDPSSYEDTTFGYDRQGFLASGRTVYVPENYRDYQPEAAEEVPAEPAPETEPVAAEPAEEAAPEPVRPEVLKAQEKGLPAPPAININDWQYMLVNPSHLLDATYAPEELAYLAMTGEDTEIRTEKDDYRQVVDKRIAQPLIDFAQGCKAAGLPVYLSSGYRSYDEQNYLFQRKVGQGYSEEVAKTIVAYPGSSEHQTGLACDITDYYHELKDSSLEQTATYQWLRDHCTEYGFILRYPADKSGSADSITGVIYEPWHFRYVGVEAAEYIMANNLCLEEFWELYE